MVQFDNRPHALHNDGKGGALQPASKKNGGVGTIAGRIIASHNSGTADNLRLKFDAMASHDITYVNIIQQARLGGLDSFPIPYVLTNCHNSLCAVGGTINEDDHRYGLSAAIRYGGEFVPAHIAVIHQYMRERHAAPGRMVLASDSHTRYGPLGTLAIGEGGPELAKQLLGKTYDLRMPQVCAVCLTGAPQPGVGPQDVALALIAEVFGKGLVKNMVLEFVGDGISALPMDFRFGIDVMTTETTCLSSVWQTDETVRRWLSLHGRGDDYVNLQPQDGAVYDAAVFIDLSKIRPMLALPFHPSNALPIADFLQNAEHHLDAVESQAVELLGLKQRPNLRRSMLRDGGCYVNQGIIAGCSGGLYDNLRAAADILDGGGTGSGDFSLSVYPASQPMMLRLIEDGTLSRLVGGGATIRTAFCGPCFGAGDVPSNDGFSIRHTTRNFPNREGSRPSDGQAAYVALMDARSIAATARNGGRLTAATLPQREYDYSYNDAPYKQRVYNGFGNPQRSHELVYAPNITDFPKFLPLGRHLVLQLASVIFDDVTTTDELIPSGETSSYRSNPQRLAEFALSRKDPNYVNLAKSVRDLEEQRRAGAPSAELCDLLNGFDPRDTSVGSAIFAKKPGDGSAREQAASCQRVLGGAANLAHSYATKRYRSNVVNWGMLPFVTDQEDFKVGDILYFADIKDALLRGETSISATLHRGSQTRALTLELPDLAPQERDIILAGCLMNYYSK